MSGTPTPKTGRQIGAPSGEGAGYDAQTRFKLAQVGERLKQVIAWLGEDRAAQVTDKSVRQLKRYASGQEPPLGVVARLSNASGASVGWIVGGTPECALDLDLEIETLVERLKVLERSAASGPSDEDWDQWIELTAKQLEIYRQTRSLGLEEAEEAMNSASTTDLISSVAQDFALVPRLSVRAGAGNGVLASEEDITGVLAFRGEWLHRMGINSRSARILEAKGDSMEPTIRDGDVLLVDTSIDRVIDNAIYVVVYGGNVLVKRVQLRRDGSVVLSSDNSEVFDKEVVPQTEVESLHVAGRVRWFGRSI